MGLKMKPHTAEFGRWFWPKYKEILKGSKSEDIGRKKKFVSVFQELYPDAETFEEDEAGIREYVEHILKYHESIDHFQKQTLWYPFAWNFFRDYYWCDDKPYFEEITDCPYCDKDGLYNGLCYEHANPNYGPATDGAATMKGEGKKLYQKTLKTIAAAA